MNTNKPERSKLNEFKLLDDAMQHIFLQNYSEALSYLQSLEKFIELSKKLVSPFMSLTVMHNSAVCSYRLGRVSQAIEYLESALRCCEQILSQQENFSENLRTLRYISNSSLQLCTFYSQSNQHESALKYSQSALKSMKSMFTTLSQVVSQYSFVQNRSKSKQAFIDRVGKISIVLDRILTRNYTKNVNIYSGEDWINTFNIGNVMSCQPILLSDWTAPISIKQELTFSRVLQSICVMISSYFCVATELRFLGVGRVNTGQSSISKDWHDRALCISGCFLPKTCPLFQHIASSHKKYYEAGELVKAVQKRFYIKRDSEKERNASARTGRKTSRNTKNNTPLRKITPNKVKSEKRTLASTLKISKKKLLSCRTVLLNKLNCKSEATFRGGPMMRTQKITRNSSSEKEKSIELKKDYVLTSSQLYGDNSIKDEERDSIIIRKGFKVEVLKKNERVKHKERIASSTGGKN